MASMKRWAGLGLGTALLGTSLVACGGDHGEAGESGEAAMTAAEPAGEMGEGEGGEGEGGEGSQASGGMDTLPVPKRLAFMSGHVEAGLALYRAGEPQLAAPHLLHPVSETHQAERAGLDALGFTPDVFAQVSTALEEGRPAEEIEPLLTAAEQNLADMAAAAGGQPAEIIRYLMDVMVEEYTVAVTDGQVTDPREYQDAYGFAVVAMDRAEDLDDAHRQDVKDELSTLIGYWPEGAPMAPAEPSPVGQIAAQASRVVLALPSTE
ncbi:Uncharacterized conserved secreted protein [Parvularcula bermudensis HTCC2503]|uniref:Uncharacterized conserved secreted protein n=1 Tax=Parvularcula bermudensis (strain ATCC BAA-594 / HTCC2503 / KCTC 12087) TaxID=314260 RepID=E0THF0_PARBH|nr:hypothetical protein [Parvularcula bermudensis]ADM10742.1 Uncharacterized conserved secreted protein [Parvularcula bermudensis HTCC2503]